MERKAHPYNLSATRMLGRIDLLRNPLNQNTMIHNKWRREAENQNFIHFNK